MTEIWKDIQGYEGYYQVSNLGEVRSLDRLDSAGRKTYYYCDGFGFRRVSFDSEKAVRK